MTNTDAPRKILIIDDEPHVVAYLEMLLQDAGYATVSAGDGKAGLEKTRQEMPDLICLDITMPEQSGIRFYRNLREDAELANVPVVVVTAVTGKGGDPAPFKEFLSSRKVVPPPEGFFSKPIVREDFMAEVKRILG